jgi:hypothetical protein
LGSFYRMAVARQVQCSARVPPLIVETFGLSGTGKSTYARELAAELRLPMIAIRNKLEKYFYYWLFWLLNPRLAGFLATRCLDQSRHDPRLRAHKWELYLKAVGREQKARVFRGGVIDEGLINFLLTLYEEPIPPHDLLLYRDLLPPQERQIHILETNEAERLKRISARNRVGRKNFGEEYYEQWSRVVAENYRAVKRWAEHHYDCRTIVN